MRNKTIWGKLHFTAGVVRASKVLDQMGGFLNVVL